MAGKDTIQQEIIISEPLPREACEQDKWKGILLTQRGGEGCWERLRSLQGMLKPRLIPARVAGLCAQWNILVRPYFSHIHHLFHHQKDADDDIQSTGGDVALRFLRLEHLHPATGTKATVRHFTATAQ